MLAWFGINYEDFAEALVEITGLAHPKAYTIKASKEAIELAQAFRLGYLKAAAIAKFHNFERFFAIEPTATVSFASVDLDGYTCTPEISPPVCHSETKMVRRQTQDGYADYLYPPGVEVAEKDVSWETYDLLCRSFQLLQAETGLAHGTNFNWWLNKPLNRESFKDWFDSPLLSIYYRWQTAYDVQDKTTIGVEVTKESEEFWSFVDDLMENLGMDDDDVIDVDFDVRTGDTIGRDNSGNDRPVNVGLVGLVACGIATQMDGGQCESCG